MTTSSFSANKLANLISKLSEPTVGTDTLRYDIVPAVHEIISQTEDESKKVLAYVLWTKCLNICAHFDGEPMDVKASQGIVMHLKSTIKEALQFLASNKSNINEAVRLASAIIAIDVRSLE